MNALILCIGLLAQFFYTARIFVQWVQSERSRRIESPTLFWIFSVIGSILLCVYGCMRNDFAIVFGEFLSFYIYLWNLKIKGVYRHLPRWLSFLLPALPLVSLFYVFHDIPRFVADFLHNTDIPLYILVWGILGQAIFKFRFIYQWLHGVRHHTSDLPLTFWYIALTGSLMIISYGIYRHDIVIVIGQCSIFASIRNIIIGLRQGKEDRR